MTYGISMEFGVHFDQTAVKKTRKSASDYLHLCSKDIKWYSM